MTEEESPHAVLEEAGVAFDPSTQHLDLTKEEKRRTTALMLAINGYKELIIKDADYLREVRDMSRREELPPIRPATMDAIVVAAVKFDRFIAGKYEGSDEHAATRDGAQTEADESAAAEEDTVG